MKKLRLAGNVSFRPNEAKDLWLCVSAILQRDSYENQTKG